MTVEAQHPIPILQAVRRGAPDDDGHEVRHIAAQLDEALAGAADVLHLVAVGVGIRDKYSEAEAAARLTAAARAIGAARTFVNRAGGNPAAVMAARRWLAGRHEELHTRAVARVGAGQSAVSPPTLP